MNEEYEQQQQLISDAGYMGAATVLSIIGIVGFLFNACVIFIMLRDPQVIFARNSYVFVILCTLIIRLSQGLAIGEIGPNPAHRGE